MKDKSVSTKNPVTKQLRSSRKLHACKRCGHQWFSTIDPVRCASCKTPYWDRDRKRNVTVSEISKN